LRVPESLDRRTVLFLDGIRYSLHQFDISEERLASMIELLSQDEQPGGELHARISSAMLDAWALVDSAHRLRELLQQLPGMKQKTPQLQQFLRGTASVESMRHFVQHLRTGIEAHLATAMPAWGSLAWARYDPETGQPSCYSIAPGTFFPQANVPSLTYDSRTGRFDERVLLQAGSLTLDLADLSDSVKALVSWYVTWFAERFVTTNWNAADLRLVFRFRTSRAQAAEVDTPVIDGQCSCGS
jgi:hypothetical protein